jgi:YD repeat-containing protein
MRPLYSAIGAMAIASHRVQASLPSRNSGQTTSADIGYIRHDAAGNLTKKTDRLGRVIEYAYDNRNRLTTELWKTGGSTVRTLSYEYDLLGHLTGASDPAADYAFQVDALGNVWEEPRLRKARYRAFAHDHRHNDHRSHLNQRSSGPRVFLFHAAYGRYVYHIL